MDYTRREQQSDVISPSVTIDRVHTDPWLSWTFLYVFSRTIYVDFPRRLSRTV